MCKVRLVLEGSVIFSWTIENRRLDNHVFLYTSYKYDYDFF